MILEVHQNADGCLRIPPPLPTRFPRLLRGLVDAVMRGGETLLGGQSATICYRDANDNGGDADSDGSSTTTPPDGTTTGDGAPPPSGAATSSAKDPTVTDPWRGDGSWEDLAAPAARLWAACLPSGPAELEALDMVLGDVFRHGVAR